MNTRQMPTEYNIDEEFDILLLEYPDLPHD